MAQFRTISALSEGLYKEKGSRFLAFAYPIQNEDEAKEYLAVLKKEHPKARHICFAYILGADKSYFKSSDDGEPHHAAGAPILGQIRSFELTNVLIAVVRYFGGTKLGVGGLTAAYKEAAQMALAASQIIEDIEREKIIVETDYSGLPELMNFVKSNNVRILEQILKDNCVITLDLAKDNAEIIKSGLIGLKHTRLL